MKKKVTQKQREKMFLKYIMRCERCDSTGYIYCGDCAGAQCKKCFIKHLVDCTYCTPDSYSTAKDEIENDYQQEHCN